MPVGLDVARASLDVGVVFARLAGLDVLALAFGRALTLDGEVRPAGRAFLAHMFIGAGALAVSADSMIARIKQRR